MTTGRIIERNNGYGYVISAGRDPATGKYKQIWRTGFKTKTEAREKLRLHMNELADGSTPTDITVAEWLQTWINDEGKDYKPLTLKSHSHCIRHYITPRIGKIRLDKLSHTDINGLYRHWLKSLSPVTVNRIHRTLRAALNKAVKRGLISDTPLKRVDTPSGKSPKRDTLNVRDALRMLAWLQENKYVAYYGAYLAVYGGLRLGEVCGLQWRDVDFHANTVHVRRTRQRLNKQEIITEPKTADSTRDIVLPAFVMDELSKWKQATKSLFSEMGMPWTDETFVVLKSEMTLPESHAFAKGVRAALTELGLPLVTFHDLRHTHATWLLESGVDLKTVSQRLGHSSITVTADVYSHVTRKMQQEAMNKLEEMMSEERGKKDDL